MRGNGLWPGWNQSTGHRYADPLMDHESRISTLEAEVREVRADQDEDHSILVNLHDSFVKHTSRTLAQIIRQRWDEILGYVVFASALSYANQESLVRLGWYLVGGAPG